MTSRSTGIEALIFDLDDTLVIGEASAIETFMDVCRQAEEWCGVNAERLYREVRDCSRTLWRASPLREFLVDVGLSSWEGLCSTFQGDYPNFSLVRDWAPSYRVKSWHAAVNVCGVNDQGLALVLADAFVRNRGRHLALYEDAGACLEDVSGSYRLALLTNGSPDLQHEKIRATGLNEYFQEVVVSGEFGHGKPDRRLFDLLLSRLGTEAQLACMIGDSLERDVLGARDAGMRTVWLNRTGDPRQDAILPDAEVPSLVQLRGCLTKL